MSLTECREFEAENGPALAALWAPLVALRAWFLEVTLRLEMARATPPQGGVQ